MTKVINGYEIKPRADLQEADLRWANLRETNLRETNLRGADLRWADLRWADLRWADLRWADLRETNLRGADLRWASLRGADLLGATLPSYKIFPEKGSFIAYKTLAHPYIAKVFIPAAAERMSSLTERKGRVSKCKPLKIWNVITKEQVTTPIQGWRTSDVTYQIGKYTYPDSFNDDIRLECTNGIHIFLTQEEALDWHNI